jgi:hypothetical protein
MADTHPEALRVLLRLNHNLPAQQKYDQVVEMYETVIATYSAGARRLHSEADDRGIFLRVAARRPGSDLVRRAYGWAPDE